MNMCTFKKFRSLCKSIALTPKYLEKTKLINNFISSLDVDNKYLVIKMLLPMVNKRVYYLNDLQIIKIFSKIFKHDYKTMLEDLENGYVSNTIKKFFKISNTNIVPIQKSILLLNDVDMFLNHLTTLTKEKDKQMFLTMISSICTADDLKCFILFIKNDLQIKAGVKCVLDALDKHAYNHFKNSIDLKKIVFGISLNKLNDDNMVLFTPVKPMLADVCKSSYYAFKKYKDGICAEIKYDGERIQIHKDNNLYKYFSRNLKPVLFHKIEGFDEFLTSAFPSANNFILDAELILIDLNTNKFVPFGSLGINKKNLFKNSSTCLFVFDCLFYNNVSLISLPFVNRRKIIVDNINEIKNKVMVSEAFYVYKEDDLNKIMDDVIKKKLEGLILKGINIDYVPGKRGWLKMKKDYLDDGSMADSADLVVLGSYYGKGSKGGAPSIFLMGCYDKESNNWKTVTKCSGHDDDTLKKVQKEIEFLKISKDTKKIPKWLIVDKIYYPDFVVCDPKKSQVWEISGSSFTKSIHHTADGISIRFPRFKKIRYDKNWLSATSLNELKNLYKES
ncbi:DNA ligase-like protein [Lumpy skin disease virus]|uniref:DNA ligase n=1 Tax=Lumpy skin disease virus TaxID=59509 RepID=A0A8E7SJY6_LSDV|nr:DNA ligase-like protein [Lumpy skin disease virus]QZZ09361.1 DNA ligase-like protein [Lumpy skin disease virus]QZZ09517.1 DNA ligase-like protein [Lumpy skin disease virus]QZZ09673.1 DNA ligase-like protein [Lumpy skin disease virus]QZZ09829.1 DNA ligase-like protein [Lumpy skin disease virus]